MNVFRNSFYLQQITLLLSFYLFNISINPHDNDAFNGSNSVVEIESLTELVFEDLCDVYDFPETEEQETSGKNTSQNVHLLNTTEHLTLPQRIARIGNHSSEEPENKHRSKAVGIQTPPPEQMYTLFSF